jgi:hypothetical protein
VYITIALINPITPREQAIPTPALAPVESPDDVVASFVMGTGKEVKDDSGVEVDEEEVVASPAGLFVVFEIRAPVTVVVGDAVVL